MYCSKWPYYAATVANLSKTQASGRKQRTWGFVNSSTTGLLTLNAATTVDIVAGDTANFGSVNLTGTHGPR